jgi:hypothetical protein
MRTIIGILFASLCACEGEVAYQQTPTTYASVGYDSPDLAYVSPDVQVVADYDVPVFFSGGAYWRYSDGDWYRSNHYAHGWAYDRHPPYAVTNIREPHAYAHYRPNGYVAHHRTYARPEAIHTHHAHR